MGVFSLKEVSSAGRFLKDDLKTLSDVLMEMIHSDVIAVGMTNDTDFDVSFVLTLRSHKSSLCRRHSPVALRQTTTF